jgi:hypothetical protein
MVFPDQIHLEQIRKDLWSGREYGRAAALIGAGFSRNGIPAKAFARPIPLWGELAKMLIDELFPTGSSPEDERKAAMRQAESTSGALRLAQEFQAAHGRQRLDQFLKEAIADQEWRPGPLHRLLMELPWSDVFTTNYDTLLERAADVVVDRRYSIIRTYSEIPFAAKPRIIKLHGSFPSNRPFIVTEEDYRTFPRQFPPIINLVQQSMMENVFCMIGFSGDDPNFLHWSGWVRDNLGQLAPRMYLCGVLNLNAAKRQMLHDRNVTPVDLSPFFPKSSYPDRAERHRAATEWFLLNLEAGARPEPLLWPHYAKAERTTPSPGLPPLLPIDIPETIAEPMFPKVGK